MYEGNMEVVNRINKSNPVSVFEFGCGTGKNLHNIDAAQKVGVDLSRVAIDDGLKTYPDLVLRWSDESILPSFRNNHYDVSFTISVLDHIEHPGWIIDQLKRISQKVYLFESNDTWHEFCYPHDYDGFTATGYEWDSPLIEAKYKLYEWVE